MYAVLIAPGLIKKIQFIKVYAVLIAPGLIKKMQFIKGYAVLIAITPTLTACNLSMLK